MTRSGGPAGDDLVDLQTVAGTQVVRLPTVIRGAAIMPPWPRVGDIRAAVGPAPAHRVLGPTLEGCYLVARPMVDRATLALTGATQVLVLPAPDPGVLLEPDPAAAVRELLDTPFDEVLAFIDAVGQALRSRTATAAAVGGLLAATSQVADRAHRGFLVQLPALFDGESVGRMVDRDLGTSGSPGRAALERWAEVPEPPAPAMTARLAAAVPGLLVAPRSGRPASRAVPTRQLHLTAGNAPVVPVASLLWAWATKGACVVKPAAEAAGLVAALASALREVDGAHPIARHTTLSYWVGGDRRVEDVLLANGAFDRRVVWGSSAAVSSLTRRGGATDTVVMRPRHALSLIGRAAVRADPEGAARRAAVDSLVANQAACTSSLLHVVEGDVTEVDAYIEALTQVLARWDEALPHRPSRQAQGRLAALRRGLLMTGRWHVNGAWPEVSSAVVLVPGSFDLAGHPGSRLVLVRATDDLGEALGDIGPSVSTVGVAPEDVRITLRDDLVARGVDNVVPLGAAEAGYPGRPHDGMRVLSRLVRWVNG